MRFVHKILELSKRHMGNLMKMLMSTKLEDAIRMEMKEDLLGLFMAFFCFLLFLCV
jgi:hypothetical protein